ncbi:MAG: 50S ribosomal protein L24 [Peptococcaceae bacterium BRH_c4a]|nr:MAG: 50S ribosomal protein L24 [Peptococcaceae bacterium BRH_c4a]
MPKVHVRKGDTVLVTTGKDRGKKGKIINVDPEKGRVIIDGINIVKRHSKPTQKMPQGGIIEKPAPIQSSNVMLFCAKCSSPTRINKKTLGDGERVRVCKKCGEVLG